MIAVESPSGAIRHVNSANVLFVDPILDESIEPKEREGARSKIIFNGAIISTVLEADAVSQMIAEDLAHPTLLATAIHEVNTGVTYDKLTVEKAKPQGKAVVSPTVEVPTGVQEPLPGTETPEVPKTPAKPAKAASKTAKAAKKASKSTIKKAAAKKTPAKKAES